ncbi:MAG: metal-dependent transcriptional regulator [Planctomycetaceae bacterium]
MTTTDARSSSQQDYLKAVFHLGRGGRRVLTTELARFLGVSKPSVTAMLKKLGEEGLVEYSPRQGVVLSGAGSMVAMRVVRRHRLVEAFLVRFLGLDWSEVHEEAEVLEHHLSDRMVEAIDRALGHPTEDPHGHPIPDASGSMRERPLQPLARMRAGEKGVVREVRTNDAERLHRFKELGLVPGAKVRMRERQELEDVMHLDVGERLVVTGSEGVEGVFVEVTR